MCFENTKGGENGDQYFFSPIITSNLDQRQITFLRPKIVASQRCFFLEFVPPNTNTIVHNNSCNFELLFFAPCWQVSLFLCWNLPNLGVHCSGTTAQSKVNATKVIVTTSTKMRLLKIFALKISTPKNWIKLPWHSCYLSKYQLKFQYRCTFKSLKS